MASILQINIAGVPLDLFDNEEENFYLTKQVHDLENLQTRNADFSKSITIPLTPRNLAVFGDSVPSKNRFNDEAIASIPAEVLIKGVPVIQDSILVIGSESVKDRTLEITIIGGTARFFNQLTEQPISALNLSDLGFEYDLDGITPLVEAPVDLIFAKSIWYTNKTRREYLANNGDDVQTSLNIMELGESGIFMYLKSVLDRIFGNLVNIVVDDSLMDALYSSMAFAIPVPIVHESFQAIAGTFAHVKILNYINTNVATAQRIPYDIIVEDAVPPMWQPASFQFLIPEDGFYLVQVDFSGFTNGGMVSNDFTVKRNGFEIDKVSFTGGVFDGEIKTSINGIAGDVVFVENRIANGGLGSTVTIEESNFVIEQQGVGRGRTVNISELIPEISQKTFVREMFKLQNIVPISVPNGIQLRYFEEIKNVSPIFLPINTRENIKISSGFPSYGRLNIMKYTDNEAVEREDANSNFIVNNKTIIDETVKILSAFSACDLSDVSNGIPLKFVSIPNYELAAKLVTDNKMTVQNGGTTYSTADRNDIKAGDFISLDHSGVTDKRRVIAINDDFSGIIDIGWSNNKNDSDWWHWNYTRNEVELHLVNIENEAGVNLEVQDGGLTRTYATYLQAKFEVLRWNNLQATYYQLIVDAMFNPFLLVAWMDFGVVKYVSIDGLQPIYVEEYDAYFYANKIEQWKHNGSTRVELLEIPI